METTSCSPVTTTSVVDPALADTAFANRFSAEMDRDDVTAARHDARAPEFVLLDIRSQESFVALHLPGASACRDRGPMAAPSPP